MPMLSSSCTGVDPSISVHTHASMWRASPSSRLSSMSSAVATALKRRVTRRTLIGDVVVGAGAPIVVQSMTNTDTADADATTGQVAQLAQAGSELVRITVNSPE